MKTYNKEELKKIARRGKAQKDYLRIINVDLEEIYKYEHIQIALTYADNIVIDSEYNKLLLEEGKSEKMTADELIEYIVNTKPFELEYTDIIFWKENNIEYTLETEVIRNADKIKTTLTIQEGQEEQQFEL